MKREQTGFCALAIAGFTMSTVLTAVIAGAILVSPSAATASATATKTATKSKGGTLNTLAPTKMAVLNGATFFRIPTDGYPTSSDEFKKRKAVRMWVVRTETVEAAGQYKEGQKIAEERTFQVSKLNMATDTTKDDCGIEESWAKTAVREGKDESLSAKIQNKKSTSYWNTKGFEIPEGYELVDTKTETKLTDSLLLELVNKAGGEKWMAAEFKKGEARFFVVPESTEDEFRSFFTIYYRSAAKAGMTLVKRIDFIESCP